MQFGLLATDADGRHPAADLPIARAAAGLARHGIEPRHLRVYRTGVEREAGLVEQLVAPVLRARSEEARTRATEKLRELAGAVRAAAHRPARGAPPGPPAPLSRAYRERRRSPEPGRRQTAVRQQPDDHRPPSPGRSRGSRTVQELRVVGVRVELPGNQPILLLKETQGERYLPIWIGAVEAAAIAFEQQGVRPARPMTHDLLREVVARPRRDASRRSTSPRCATASTSPSSSSATTAWSAPGPSDAVALAVRTGAPIYGAEDLLDEVGIEIPDEQEDEVEKFREFLDQISPEDFGAGSGSGGPRPGRAPALTRAAGQPWVSAGHGRNLHSK